MADEEKPAPSSQNEGSPAETPVSGGEGTSSAAETPISGTEGTSSGAETPISGGEGISGVTDTATSGVSSGATSGATSGDISGATSGATSDATSGAVSGAPESPSSPTSSPSTSTEVITTTDSRGSKIQIRRRRRGEKIDMTNARIGFVGAGKMAEAITKGLLSFCKVDGNRIFVSSKSGKNHEHFKQLGAKVTKRSYDIFARMDCDVVFLVVHGYVVRNCFKQGGTRPAALTTNYIPNQKHPLYLLSMIGGISLNDIKHCLLNPDNPERYKLEMHRVMLNASVAYGIGLGAIDIEPDSKKCSPIIRDMLTAMAKIEFVPEANMDVACAVGGNGLAFCYYFLSALADGGFKMGLPKAGAVKLAAKTLQSAAASLLESGKHPSELRDQCTSPSGPTIYGLHVLDKADCSSGIAAAVEAAFKRIKELVENSLN